VEVVKATLQLRLEWEVESALEGRRGNFCPELGGWLVGHRYVELSTSLPDPWVEVTAEWLVLRPSRGVHLQVAFLGVAGRLALCRLVVGGATFNVEVQVEGGQVEDLHPLQKCDVRVVCISDGPTEEGGPGILARLVSALPGSQEVSGTDGKDVSSHEVNGADFKSAEIPVKKKKRKELARKDIDTQKLKEVKLDKIKENPGKVKLKDVSKEVKVDKVKIKKIEKVKAKKLGTVNVEVEMTEDVSAANMEDQNNLGEEVVDVKTDSSSSFKCTICSKVCKSKGSLERHAGINHKSDIVASEAIRGDDRKFWCTLCPYSSQLKSNIRAHLYGKHNLGPGYDCPKCGQKFKQKKGMVNTCPGQPVKIGSMPGRKGGKSISHSGSTRPRAKEHGVKVNLDKKPLTESCSGPGIIY